MKKIITLLLSFTLIFGLTSCTDTSKENTNETNNNHASVETNSIEKSQFNSIKKGYIRNPNTKPYTWYTMNIHILIFGEVMIV